jgi:hypothetical protein
MMVNLAALGFTAVLAVAGIWLVIQLADLRKNQDCVLSGRRNCAPIDGQGTGALRTDELRVRLRSCLPLEKKGRRAKNDRPRVPARGTLWACKTIRSAAS